MTEPVSIKDLIVVVLLWQSMYAALFSHDIGTHSSNWICMVFFEHLSFACTYAIGGTSSECCVLLFPIGVVLLPFRAEHCGSAHRHNLIILTLGILFEVVSGFSGDVFSCFWVDSVIGVVVLGVPGDDIVDTFSCCSCVISIFS